MLPSKETAIELLNEGYEKNPGPWREHSIVAAECAYNIAKEIPEMDENKAYILGLLHDIGRRFGVTQAKHIIDGYDFMMELGYEEVARICLTHSFSEKYFSTCIGREDVTEQEKERICELMERYEYDDYDLLIQVCDSISLPSGPVDMVIRMQDVKERYGEYPESKWNKNLELKQYFDLKVGKDIYEIVK